MVAEAGMVKEVERAGVKGFALAASNGDGIGGSSTPTPTPSSIGSTTDGKEKNES